MKVSEELDALRTMGFGPMRYLAFPRVLALLLVVPLLTVVADFFGVLGGMTVARYNLHISATAYLTETRTAILPWDVAGGLIVKALSLALEDACLELALRLASEQPAEQAAKD
jgi:phospholipid/cholesterol/gamma-HCH transport system permease protein